jgi:thiol-disulfide isomerase/thioredoxin
MKIVNLALLAAVFTNIEAFSQEMELKVLKSSKDWEAAKIDAKNSGKDIFLDIYATWCGPCKMMESDVYTDPAVAVFFNSNYVNLKIDGESDFGLVLAAQYKLSAYPSLYFINSEEKLIYEAVGYREPDALILAGTAVKESGKRYLELSEIYNSSSLTPEQTEEFMGLLAKFEQKDILALLAADKIKSFTEADILNPANMAIIQAVGGDIESFPVKTAMHNADSMKNSWGEQDFNQFLSEAFNLSMQRATQDGDSALMEKIATEFIPVYMKANPDRIPEAQLTTRKIYYSEVKDWKNYIESVENHFRDFQNGNPRFLYLESYYIVENQLFEPELLNKANEWLEKIIAIHPDFESYFLAAIVNTYNNNSDATKKWMELAEGLAVSQDEKDSLEELKKFLQEQ